MPHTFHCPHKFGRHVTSVISWPMINLTWLSWDNCDPHVEMIGLHWRVKQITQCVSVRWLFHFGGHRICHTFFLFLRAMGTKRFKAIKQSWLERGLCPRIALKILPHNTTKGYQMSNAQLGLFSSMQKITPFCFLVEYLGTNALTCSCSHHKPPNGRCGWCTTRQHQLVQTQRVSVIPSFALSGSNWLHRSLWLAPCLTSVGCVSKTAHWSCVHTTDL